MSSGSAYESAVGYSRAVRTGAGMSWWRGQQRRAMTLSGTDPRAALRRIESALRDAGASLADVVRTRMFVTDIWQWREVGGAHGAAFGDIRPVATMVEGIGAHLPASCWWKSRSTPTSAARTARPCPAGRV